MKTHGLLPGDNFVCDLEATGTNGTNDNVAAATVASRARTFLQVDRRLRRGQARRAQALVGLGLLAEG